MNEKILTTDVYIEQYLKNNPKKTIEDCIFEINKNNSDFIVYFKLGFAYFILEDNENSIKYFNISNKLNSNFLLTYYFRGIAEIKIDVDKGIEDFKKALEIEKEEPIFYFYLGISYKLKKIYKEAIKYFTKCIDLDFSMKVDAYYYRAECYYKIENYNLAINDLNNVIEINPNYYGAYFYRGCLKCGNLDIQKGLEDLTNTIKNNEEEYLFEALRLKSSYLTPQEVLDECNKIINNGTNEYRIYAIRSSFNNSLKHFENALKDSELFLSKYPKNSWGLMNKGDALIGLQRYNEAINVLNSALEIEPKHCGVLQSLASAFEKMEKYNEAIQFIDKSLIIDNENAQHYLYRGFLKLKIGQYKNSIEDFDKSINICNTLLSNFDESDIILPAYINKCIAYINLDNYKFAISNINEILKILPENAKELIENLEILKLNLEQNEDIQKIEKNVKYIIDNYFTQNLI